MMIRLVIAATLLGAVVQAQSAHDWASVSHTPALTLGTEIEVRTIDKKRHRGLFKAAEESSLIMMVANSELSLPSATVLRISVKKTGHRLRNTLIGLGIGAAAGLSLGAIADARCTGKCVEGNTPLGKEVGTPLGALIGTIIGVALPTGGWREVYRARVI